MKTCTIDEWFLGGLTRKERDTLITLEYILTWGYSDDLDKVEKQYKSLSDRTWSFRDNHKIIK